MLVVATDFVRFLFAQAFTGSLRKRTEDISQSVVGDKCICRSFDIAEIVGGVLLVTYMDSLHKRHERKQY
jgi:hypothetical protein